MIRSIFPENGAKTAGEMKNTDERIGTEDEPE